MKTIKLTTAQALIKFLENQNFEDQNYHEKIVDGIFTIYGHGMVTGLGDALTSFAKDLKVYQGKNEQGMAHIAIGYSKTNLRKKVLAVTTSIGPGSTNLVTAAATATANNLPLLLFPSDTFASRQPDPVLQQIEFDHNYSITVNDSLKQVSKYWDRINRPEQLMTALLNGFRILTDPSNTGAITISIPQDVWGESYDYPVEFFQQRSWTLERFTPTKKKINQFIDLLTSSQRPFIVVGGGVLYSEAQDELWKLIKKCQIPFACTQAGKGAMIDDGQFNFGGLGVTGTISANSLAQKADLIIGVGTRYTDFTTGSKTLFDFQKVKFVNLNINKKEGLKLDALSLLGDARETLKLINQKIKMVNYQATYQDEILVEQKKWQKIKEKIVGEKKILISNDQSNKIVDEFKQIFPHALHKASTFEMLQQAIKKYSKGAIVIGAAGSLPSDMHSLWNVEEFNSYNVEYGYSCMGYEIQAAIGAKLAKPEKEVYAFVGDGSFLMLHSEIVTAIQEGIKINIILFDNSGFGCIDNLQTNTGIPTNATHFRMREKNEKLLTGPMLNINYQKIMEAYGGDGLKIENYQEIDNVIKSAVENQKITLIEIKVLPKTMTEGGKIFWRTGISSNSPLDSVKEQYKKNLQIINNAKKY